MGQKKKTAFEVDEILARLGAVVRVSDYKGADQNLKVRCILHSNTEEVKQASHWLRGRPMSCCKRKGGPRKLDVFTVDIRIAIHNKVKRVDPYVAAQQAIRFQCLTHHGHIALMSPGHAMEGRHLDCCSVPREERSGGLARARSVYEDRLKRHGRVKLLPGQKYVNQSTPLLHRCLVHDQILPGLPQTLARGFGLRCCLNFASSMEAARRRNMAALTFDERVCAKGRVVRIEKADNRYVDSKTPLLFRCLLHNEVYPAVPGNIIAGQGLRCCLRETWESDSLSKFDKNPDRASSDCCLYLSWAFNDEYLKPGIARSLEQREDDAYGDNILLLTAPRAECWVAEQVVLGETRFASDLAAPLWPGRTELRKSSQVYYEDLAVRMSRLLQSACRIGWRLFARKHLMTGWELVQLE